MLVEMLVIAGWVVAAVGVLVLLACLVAVFGFASDTVGAITKRNR